MKKFLAAFTAIIMALSLVTVPAAMPAEESVPPAEVNYTFDSDLQGWTAEDRDNLEGDAPWHWENGQAVVNAGSDYCSTDNDWLISPEINLPGAAVLKFDYRDLSTAWGRDDRLDVYIIIDGEEILLQTFDSLVNADGDMYHAEIDISDKDTAEAFSIAFRYYQKNNPDQFTGAAVDNIEIIGGSSEIPTAEPPTAEPPTAEPPTAEPPTAEPPTAEPPTAEPPTAEPPTAEPPTDEPPTDEPISVFDFNAEDPLANGWEVLDVDGNGKIWRWVEEGDPEFTQGSDDPGDLAYYIRDGVIEGHGMMGVADDRGGSCDEHGNRLTAENWLISPVIPAGAGSVTVMLGARVKIGLEDYLKIRVSTNNGETWSSELASFKVQNEDVLCEADISAYMDSDIRIAFIHYACDGGGRSYGMCIDKVSLMPYVEPVVTPTPEPTPVPTPRPHEGDGVELNGYVVSGAADATVYLAWARFMDYYPESVEQTCEMPKTFGAAFAGGNVYGFLCVMDNNGNLADTRFYTMDPETFEVTYSDYESTENPNDAAAKLQILGMAYDYSTDTMYALSSRHGGSLWKVNLAVGILEFAADLDQSQIMTLAIDGEGNAYGLSYSMESSTLWDINLETGECTAIGQTGVPLNFVQSMTWDHNTDRLFWSQCFRRDLDTPAERALYEIDPETGLATQLGIIDTGSTVAGLWTANDIPIPAPEIPNFSVTFIDGFTGQEIGSISVPAGTLLNESDLPEPPNHEDEEYVFSGWDYRGKRIYADTVITAKYHYLYDIGFYFETDPALEGWSWVDADGDGYNWRWLYEESECPFIEGVGMMNSQSYVNYVGPLDTDNWLISPTVPGGGTLKFKFVATDSTYCDERIEVYASVDGGESWDFDLEVYTATGEVQAVELDLSDFDGMDIKLAFRHHNTDMYSVNIDEVIVNIPESALPVPPTEEPPTAEPPTAEPPTEEPPTAEPPTAEPEPQEGDVIFDIRNPETADGLYYAQPGETVTVEFTVTGEYAAHGLTVNFNYDPELLTIESLEEGAAMAEIRKVALPVLDYETIPGSICLGIMAPTDPFSAQGVIYTVSFKVAETAELGAVLPLEIEVTEFFNMPVGEEATPIAWFAYNSGIVIGDAPVLPTEPPTEEPPTEEPPTETPTTPPTPPTTGFISLAGAGIAAILAGAGVVLLKRKRS